MVLKYVSCVCYMATSHKNTPTVRNKPTPKNEGRFRNGLVRGLKVNERKLLRKSKT